MNDKTYLTVNASAKLITSKNGEQWHAVKITDDEGNKIGPIHYMHGGHGDCEFTANRAASMLHDLGVLKDNPWMTDNVIFIHPVVTVSTLEEFES